MEFALVLCHIPSLALSEIPSKGQYNNQIEIEGKIKLCYRESDFFFALVLIVIYCSGIWQKGKEEGGNGWICTGTAADL